MTSWISKLLVATEETLLMSLISFAFAFIIGLPLGILLSVTSETGLRPCAPVNKVLGVIVNVFRSIPFLIVFAMIYPVMSDTMGKYAIGWTAMIPPLVLSAAPFIARLVETSLAEVPRGVVEAVKSLGASDKQVVTRVYLTEARPSLIMNAVVAFVTILGYTAMSGIVAGGGLGDLALNYAFRHVTKDPVLKTRMVWLSSIIIILLVNVLQEISAYLVKRIDHRNKI